MFIPLGPGWTIINEESYLFWVARARTGVPSKLLIGYQFQIFRIPYFIIVARNMERRSKSSAKSMSLHTQRTFRASFLPFGRFLIILVSLLAIPVHAIPTVNLNPIHGLLESEEPEDLDTADIVGRLSIIAFLVLTGGVFAGLTLGLMGLDETTLRVLIQSGQDDEKANASKVLNLLENGKHWVLVTLLLGNVIVNETLPIILDSVFGGGWQAVLISTGLIVIFGEIIPQAICVRYGLKIGAYLSPFVLCLMYVLYPLAYPVAMLLDYFLGEHHGTVYRRTELKTLVSLHQTHSPADVDGLTEDEVTIIGAVLELRQKPVSQVMTPMEDVYTLSSDHILDRATTEQIRMAGYSRIPIHSPNNKSNFLGMLLVKQLIVYDPEEAQPVSSFTLSPLPTVNSDTSCLDILNFFQEGRSHMALIKPSNSEEHTTALGVITLEDVIEELIGEEIIDETDVFIDVHNKIRVLHPPTSIRSHPPKLHHIFNQTRRQTAPGDFPQLPEQSKGKKNDQKGANVKIGKYGAVMGEERRTNENEPLIKK